MPGASPSTPALLADPSRLVVYQTRRSRPRATRRGRTFILDRLTNATLDFSPQAGIGTASAPFSGRCHPSSGR